MGVVLFNTEHCINTAKGSPALTAASKDHRGSWRGVTRISSLSFLIDTTEIFLSQGLRFSVFQVLLSLSLITRYVFCNGYLYNNFLRLENNSFYD
jgi:hypothetical protein